MLMQKAQAQSKEDPSKHEKQIALRLCQEDRSPPRRGKGEARGSTQQYLDSKLTENSSTSPRKTSTENWEAAIQGLAPTPKYRGQQAEPGNWDEMSHPAQRQRRIRKHELSTHDQARQE